MRYSSLYEFTPRGLIAFKLAFTGQLREEAVNLSDPELAVSINGTGAFVVEPFATAKEMAAAILAAFGEHHIAELGARAGLWAWLTFVLRDVLFPANAAGQRKFREIHRWFPSDPGDFQKAQRHLVRMPVVLVHELGSNADHLVNGAPGILPDIREQLTSQQDMFHPTFQAVARRLYFDDQHNRLKRGAGSKGGGSPRRLADNRKQFDVTWDLYDLTPDRLLALLPREFDRFRPNTKT